MKRSGHRDEVQRAARFETCEARLVMTAQPVDVQLSLQVEATPAWDVPAPVTMVQSSAHDQSGWTAANSEYGFSGRGQTVAVIDTGIGYDHTALGGGYGAGYRVVGGWDFAENDANPYDDGPLGSHGTHVAGIIGARDATYGGVAQNADLVALRVFDDQGNGSFAWIEQALQWVHNNRNSFANPITTVNLSIGTAWNSTTVPNWTMLEDEFAQLEADGIFIAVAAGNSFTSYNAPGLSYPAASPHVVPVMSVDANGQLSSFSQREQRAIAAPGRSIISTVPDYRGNQNTRADDWVAYSGTSMATPYLAGASTIIREAYAFLNQPNVSQDQINNLLRATADSVYDSATSQSYLRLNLDRALDALMPADEYGQTAATGAQLGTLSSRLQTTGMISTLGDRDAFTFTAAQSGRVNLAANLARGTMDFQWQLSSGTATISGAKNENVAFDVVAGQTYTLTLSGTGGLGYYGLSFNLTPSVTQPPAQQPPSQQPPSQQPGAVAWGRIEQWNVYDQQVSGQNVYSVIPVRDGTLTIEAMFQHARGNVDLELVDASGRVLAASNSSTNYERVDAQVSLGQTYFLRVSGQNADVDYRVSNLVQQSGSTLRVFGTSGNDTFAVRAQESGGASLGINNVAYSTASGVTNVEFIDIAGRDHIAVVGTSANETFVIGPTRVQYSGAISVVTNDAETVVVQSGGGVDSLTMNDSAGDDTFVARPDGAWLSGAGYTLAALGFSQVQMVGSGGYDYALLLDSAGNDTLVGSGSSTRIYGTGFDTTVTNFDVVRALASTGYDQATFNDSTGNENFVASATQAELSGASYRILAENFDRVRLNGAGGTNVATLINNGGQVLTGATMSQLKGTGYEITLYNFGRPTVQNVGGQSLAAQSLGGPTSSEGAGTGSTHSSTGDQQAAATDAVFSSWSHYVDPQWFDNDSSAVSRRGARRS